MPRTPGWRLGDLPAYELGRDREAMIDAAARRGRGVAVAEVLRGREISVDGFDRSAVEAVLASVITALPAGGSERLPPRTADHPTLTILFGSTGGGRSRALARVVDPAPAVAVLNARDLDISVHGAEGRDLHADSTAEYLERLLTAARAERQSVALEGIFRSPALISGIARTFAAAGFSTRVVAIADSAAEIRMGAASIGLSALREHGTADQVPYFDAVDDLLSAVSPDPHVHRVTVFDRAGGLVVDAADPEHHADAAIRYREAAASPLGTLRSVQWLSELRHMGRFVAERRSAPRWALEGLVELHEVALEEILPELAVPANAEAFRLQSDRLQRGLTALRLALADHTPAETVDPNVRVAQPDSLRR